VAGDDALAVPDTGASDELIRVNDRLARTEALDPELVQVVECLFRLATANRRSPDFQGHGTHGAQAVGQGAGVVVRGFGRNRDDLKLVARMKSGLGLAEGRFPGFTRATKSALVAR